MLPRIKFVSSLVFLVCFLDWKSIAGALPAEQEEFFERRIRPVLAEHCYKCHSTSSEKLKGGLKLDARESTLKGGDTGPAVVPGDLEKSLLILAIRHADPDLQMPPKEQLSPEQIQDFERWVQMGAPDPREATLTVPVENPPFDWEEAKKFWSFQPLRPAPLHLVPSSEWSRHEVDQFIAAKHQETRLLPAADADRRVLLRRATFDLTGLPPSPEEVDAFEKDDEPDAFAKVVERLLASPAYGERWGRHWLDLVRYADTSGCNSDYPIPSAHKYRDYVIESFNRDKPYDQFVREQIAGDLLPHRNEAERFEQTIATGYLAISRRFGSRNNEFHLTIEDTIDNVGKAILGLSVSCARCHDHKFDPVPARDYYALYGIFQSTRYAFPGTEIYKHPKDFVPLAPPEEAKVLLEEAAELAALDDKIENLRNEKKALERAEKIAAADTPAAGEKEAISEAPAAPPARTLDRVKAELEDVRTRQRMLEEKPAKYEKAYAVAEGKTVNARIHKRGDPKVLGDEVPRGFLQVLGGQQLPTDTAGGSSGRLELAQWLTDPANPLTARVMVNRIWQGHFGRGLNQTPNDFGTRGERPTHPELLDHLAARFIESGWSIKAMHRLLMLSRTYRMASTDNAVHTALDPENDYLWRFPRRRLSAEEIRDSMLTLSGALDRSPAGPHPFAPENDWRYTQHKPFIEVFPTTRRSIYLMQQRIKKHPFLEIFDGADTNVTTAYRPLSTTPIQALFMMNDPFAHAQADGLGVRVGMAHEGGEARIRYAYRLLFHRPPTTEELQAGIDYLNDCKTALAATNVPSDQQPRAALASYARVLFGSNEFVFVD